MSSDERIAAIYRELGALSGELSATHLRMSELCEELVSLQASKLLEMRLPRA